MKLFGWVLLISVFAFGIVVMRIEVNRSGRAIGKLQNEVEIKQARNQYLQLETARLSGPSAVKDFARERLHLRRTPPQNIVVLED